MKHILIIGGNRGLGLELKQGHFVTATYYSSPFLAELLAEYPHNLATIKIDVSREFE